MIDGWFWVALVAGVAVALIAAGWVLDKVEARHKHGQ